MKSLVFYRKFSKIISYLKYFIFSISGVVALEIALILPLFLTLLLAIIELSIIFSLRSGIEEISRDISRKAFSISGAQSNGGTGIISSGESDDEILTNAIYDRLSDTVINIENSQLCVAVYGDIRGYINSGSSQGTCIQFSDSRPSSTVNFGEDGEYAAVFINYTHEYLTPFGNLLGNLGANITFTVPTLFRNEGEEDDLVF